jgi:hypothetical protein
MPATAYEVLADIVLLVHAMFVVFVVGGLALVLLGGKLDWRWVRNRWFRLAHLFAIVFVASEAWLAVDCPLTVAEMALRHRAGDAAYAGSFIGHWLQSIFYYDAPPVVFVVAYTIFALLVCASWLAVRPAPFGGRRTTAAAG